MTAIHNNNNTKAIATGVAMNLGLKLMKGPLEMRARNPNAKNTSRVRAAGFGALLVGVIDKVVSFVGILLASLGVLVTLGKNKKAKAFLLTMGVALVLSFSIDKVAAKALFNPKSLKSVPTN
jgi:hypothetical protein